MTWLEIPWHNTRGQVKPDDVIQYGLSKRHAYSNFNTSRSIKKQRMNVYLPFMTFLNPTDNQMTESKAQGFEYYAFGWVRWS